MSQQAHGPLLWREAAGSGAVPTILALRLVADPSGVGHTFSVTGAPVGSLVADPTLGFVATLGDFSADAAFVRVGGVTYVY